MHNRTLVASSLLVAAAVAGAQTIVNSTSTSSSTSTSTSTSTSSTGTSSSSSSVSHRCGGIGEADQRAMKADAAKYALLLTFAAPGGAYLAGVDVEIRAGNSVSLKARCEGPLMLVDLSGAASYEVIASYRGQVQRKTFRPGGGKPTSMTFTWAAS